MRRILFDSLAEAVRVRLRTVQCGYRIDRHELLAIGYLTVGIWAVHAMHIARFRLVGWRSISALPNYQISLELSFWLGLALPMIVASAVIYLRKHSSLAATVCCFVIVETISQVLGRSLMKFIVDLGIWCIVVCNHLLVRLYGDECLRRVPVRAMPILHAELLGILRTLVNVCLFVIGTLGISVASQVISKYFTDSLGQGTAWCYVGSILYLAFGMFSMLVFPLFRMVIAARMVIVKAEQTNREN